MILATTCRRVLFVIKYAKLETNNHEFAKDK